MKRGLQVAILMGVALAIGLWAGGAQAQMTMKFAHFADEGHPGHLAAKQFSAAVEQRTKGQIKIQIFPNNALGAPPEQAEQVKMGVTDMGLPTRVSSTSGSKPLAW